MDTFLITANIIFSIVLIVSILLQGRGTSVGLGMGGDEQNITPTKSGAENFLFWTSTSSAIGIFALSVYSVIV